MRFSEADADLLARTLLSDILEWRKNYEERDKQEEPILDSEAPVSGAEELVSTVS